ncbi:MAG: hypothetical protein ABIJ46_04900 [bacterium]
MKNLIKKAAVPLSAIGTTLAMLPAKAADFSDNLSSVGVAAYGGEPSKDLLDIVGSVIFAAMGLLGVVLLVLILYGGFLWMTAGGNDDQVGKAKKIITNSVIGLVIIMAAYAIATFVFEAIITASA